MAEKNLYSSNHNYAIKNHQENNSSCNIRSSKVLSYNNQQKQDDAISLLYCNFNNKKEDSLICQYKHQYFYCTSTYLAKDCFLNVAVLEPNFLFV